MTTTAIVKRTVGVTVLDEGAGLSATIDPAEDWQEVRLTADLLGPIGAPPLEQGGGDWACQLDLLYLDEDGVTDGIPLTVGESLRDLTLTLYDRRTYAVIGTRSTTVETFDGSGVYQITVDPDQASRIQGEDPEILPGNAGRLVIRWSYVDAHPPVPGLWAWELATTLDEGIGPSVLARGLLEVLQ